MRSPGVGPDRGDGDGRVTHKVIARAIAPTRAPFAFQCSSSIIHCSQPNMNTEPGLQRLTEIGLDFLAIIAAEFQFRAVVQRDQKVSV